MAPSFTLSAINDHVSDSSSEDARDSANERSCTFSQQNFAICVNEIIARHGTSDAEASDWIKLMRTAFPESYVPSLKSMKRKADETVKLALKTTLSCGEGELITLDFKSDILLVLKRNLNSIYEYNSSRCPLKDVNIPAFFDSSNKITVSLSMNSDGVRIINSKKRSLWPLWLGILNLPPVLQCKFANIILAKLWLGRGKPDWNVFFSQIKETLQSESSIEWNGTLWEVNFVIKLLMSDLPAKASILNMQQFNAYFGCTLCLIKSKPIGEGKKGLYYPNQRNKMRTAAQHEAYIRLIQEQAMDSFRGVKGPSAVSTLIENLPFTAPVDYMHQVLLGVTRALLFLIRDKSTKSDLNKIRENSATLQLTSDFKRSVRSLDELEFFKANELKVWLLYVGPAVFRSFVNESLYERFHLLSYSTRLLLFSSEHCRVAENLIERFHLLTAEAHSDKVFSANIHSLNHLAWQVRCFGHLWCTSATMFESANYLLRCKFTGTVCHLKVLVDRYLRNKNSCCENPRKDTLYDLCLSLRERKSFKQRAVCLHEIPSDLKDLSAQFYSTQKFENFTLDSISHSSCRNSFISFVCDGEKKLCQIRLFFTIDKQDFASVVLYQIEKKHRPSQSTADVYSFYEVRKLENVQTISQDAIIEKLLPLTVNEKLVLVPLVNIFEHD